jgi:sugar phosphate isomerase/epimerase
MSLKRREFLAAALGASASLRASPSRPALCLFSKHLPKLNYEDLGKQVREFGFNGVDLTVRPGGHVLPENAASDLPRAVERIRAHGLEVPMITTGLTSGSDPAARPILSTAARLKVPFFKLGYWNYAGKDVEKTLAAVKRETEALVRLGREFGIAAGFHNHSGDYVGAPVWDIREIISGMDARWIGYYFDPCHAVTEGGLDGWLIALRMALPRLKMVALKDFYWEKRAGRWEMRMCPLGAGMVDWPKFFSVLAGARFSGPISLHVEYEPADEHAAIANDLAFMKKHVTAAYGR